MQTAYKKLCLEKILMYEVCLLFMSVKYEECIILCYSVVLFVVMMAQYDDMDRQVKGCDKDKDGCDKGYGWM